MVITVTWPHQHNPSRVAKLVRFPAQSDLNLNQTSCQIGREIRPNLATLSPIPMTRRSAEALTGSRPRTDANVTASHEEEDVSVKAVSWKT